MPPVTPQSETADVNGI